MPGGLFGPSLSIGAGLGADVAWLLDSPHGPALIALGLCPTAADYMLPSHRSQEPGHDRMWKAIGKEPLLDLNFRLGEGTGGAVAMHLAECACRIANDMLTFSDAGVTNADSVTVDTFADGQQLNEKDA